jgi:thiol-disulfide isomerase/thioredoxin
LNLANLHRKWSLSAKLTGILLPGLMTSSLLISIVAHDQEVSTTTKNLGDPAPLIRTKNWIKGTPVTSFEKGKIYVIEFWATWCRPCKEEMPHLSEIARRYRDSVTIIGLDIYETPKTTLGQLKSFVDSMGLQMDYNVAVADSYYIKKNWLDATGEEHEGIPRAFIVDRDGKLAWMGHPCDHFEEALFRILNGTWDIPKLQEKINRDRRLKILEDTLFEALEFAPDGMYRNENWKRDSAMLLVNEFAKTDPSIKYSPRIAAELFSILLRHDIKMAYEFGKTALANPTYESPARLIRGAIENLPRNYIVPPEIYELGISALQIDVTERESCYPLIGKVYMIYSRIAEWNWALGNKVAAIEAQEKAVASLKSRKYPSDYLPTDLPIYEAWLNHYKTNSLAKGF